jgi:hypothetical protein
MYEMSQRHPVWVTENHVNPCNSALQIQAACQSTFINEQLFSTNCKLLFYEIIAALIHLTRQYLLRFIPIKK